MAKQTKITQFLHDRNYDKRDTVIFGKKQDYNYRNQKKCYFVQELSFDKLKQLVNRKFADLNERQNGSPSIQEFLTFGETLLSQNFSLPIYYLGYALSPNLEDYPVSVHGIEIRADKNFDKQFLLSILEFVGEHQPDEVKIEKNYLIIWCEHCEG